MKKATTLTVALSLSFTALCVSSNARADDNYPNDSTHTEGPLLGIGNTVSSCAVSAAGKRCATLDIPTSAGAVASITALPPVLGSTTTWLAHSTNSTNLCGMNVVSKRIACVSMAVMHEHYKKREAGEIDSAAGFNETFYRELQRGGKSLASIFRTSPYVKRNGGEGATIMNELDPEEGDEGGGGFGDFWGGGSWGGWGGGAWGNWGGPSQSPPGSAPGDSVKKAECTAAAYRAWEIMDSWCRGSARAKASCFDTNFRLYSDELRYCDTL